jgi:hypothetical protein
MKNETQAAQSRPRTAGGLGTFLSAGIVLASAGLLGAAARPLQDIPGEDNSLKETRLTMEKWIETEQILSRERREWQQGREILVGRLELVRREVAELEESIGQAEASLREAEAKTAELTQRSQYLGDVSAHLASVVTALEGEVRRLLRSMPDPIQLRLEPLTSRIVDDPSAKRISVAERYQNVLGILNELNKANNELNVVYEVHTLEDGRPSEVQALYVGLAQAYFVSASGAAGIGRPTEAGWQWQSLRAASSDINRAIEIIQGKHSPAFVPLPVQIQ